MLVILSLPETGSPSYAAFFQDRKLEVELVAELSRVYHTQTEAETMALGAKLAPFLRVGDVVTLSAPLGTGKTALARGLIRALMGEAIEVPSPSYALVQPYDGPIPVYHADFYRLTDPADMVELGLEDSLETGIVLIEWPDLGLDLSRGHALDIRGAVHEEAQRSWTITGNNTWRERFASWS